MRIRIKTAAAVTIAVILGGILLAAALGIWQAGSSEKKGESKNAKQYAAEVEYGYL